jgi:hypothetical protein
MLQEQQIGKEKCRVYAKDEQQKGLYSLILPIFLLLEVLDC